MCRHTQILCSGAAGRNILLSRLAKPNGIGDTDGCPDSKQSAGRRNPRWVVRVLIAIELSKRSWSAAVNTPLSDKISNHTVKAETATDQRISSRRLKRKPWLARLVMALLRKQRERNRM
jgi:hypothetical protein